MAVSVGAALDGAVRAGGLLSGFAWKGALTFGFPKHPTAYRPGYGVGEPTAGFTPASDDLAEAISRLLTGASASGLSGGGYPALSVSGFTKLTASLEDVVTPDIRIAQSSVPQTAWAYLPSFDEGGDVWFGKAYDGTSHGFQSPIIGMYSYLIVLHEVGHALGLKHPHETSAFNERKLTPEDDCVEFTVMSYKSIAGGSEGYSFSSGSAPQTFMMFDIAALQQVYGANYEYNKGNDIYQWNMHDGSMFVNGQRQGAPAENRIFQTIWDGNGNDTYDLSNYTEPLQIDLRPGGWSILSRAQLALLSPGVHARGSIYNALQHSDDARSLIENALGGSDDDLLHGNTADNCLVGAGGDDTLVGGAGDDFLDGGAGFDAVDMGSVGVRGFAIGSADGNLVIASAAGTTTVTNVEVVLFADGRLVTDPADPAAWVLRLYKAALDRLPDQGGLNFWIDAAREGHLLADLADPFLSSPEFQARLSGAAADNGAFVDQLYLNVLGRPGEAEGRQFWLVSLDRGTSRAEVLAIFSESPENKASTEAVTRTGIWDRNETASEVARLYDTVFGRRPDAPGLAYWKGAIEAGTIDVAQAADEFMASAEFQGRYGALDNRGLANALYVNTLDQPADQAGLDFWTGRLDAGVPRSAVVLAFSESQEHVGLTAPAIQSDAPGEFGIMFL